MRLRRSDIAILAQFVALAAYYVPWLSNRAAALSANAYDLAEWVGVHPAVRNGNPPMVEPFLLRAVLGLLAVLFGWQALRQDANRWLRVVSGVAGVALATTLLPPPDFLRGGWDDVNYRQQALLAGLTLFLLAVGVALRKRETLVRAGLLVAGILAIIFAAVGEVLSLNVVRSLAIPAPPGIGPFVLCVDLIVVIVMVWWAEPADQR